MYEKEFKFLLGTGIEQDLQGRPLHDKVTIYQTYAYNNPRSSVRVRKVISLNHPNPKYFFCFKQNPSTEEQDSVLEFEIPISEEYYNEFLGYNSAVKEIVKTRWTLPIGPDKLIWTIDKFENGMFVGECEGSDSWVTDRFSGKLLIPNFPPPLSYHIIMITPPGKSVLSQNRILGYDVPEFLKHVYGENVVPSTK